MQVNTVELRQQADEMKSTVSKLTQARENVLRVSIRLMDESIGEKFLPALRREAREIEQMTENVIRLKQGLTEIAALYEECENGIEDHADQEGSGTTTWPTGFAFIPRCPAGLIVIPKVIIPFPVRPRRSYRRTWHRWFYPTPWRP